MSRFHYFFRSPRWHEEPGVVCSGTAFLDGRLLAGPALAAYCAQQTTLAERAEIFSTLRGFFSVVWRDGDAATVGVDRLRTAPVLYAIRGESTYVSDDPHWIKEQLGKISINIPACTEFLYLGYVTGNETFSIDILQVQPGELVQLAASVDGGGTAVEERYRRHAFRPATTVDRAACMEEMERALIRAFERLIAYANGRTIVVPLSGGYDSRLVVMMLVNLGYTNIIAYSYGKPGNQEAVASRRIAERLGIRWEFVPYTVEAWGEWYRSPEMRQYFRAADGSASIPVFNDWPALRQFRMKKIVPEDAVFVPGHARPCYIHFADFCDPADPMDAATIAREETEIGKAVDDILSSQYVQFDRRKHAEELEPLFRSRIRAAFGDLGQYPDRTSAYESWLVNERSAKFTVNSVHSYEFWGYDWWIPLWDPDFVDFWERLPPDARNHRAIYREYIDSLMERLASVQIEAPYSRGPNPVMQLLRRTVLRIPQISTMERRLFEYRKRMTAYEGHPMAWHGIVSRARFAEIYTGYETINSLVAYGMIEELAHDYPEAGRILSLVKERSSAPPDPSPAVSVTSMCRGEG